MIKIYNQNVWNYSPASYRNKLIRSLIKDFDADFCTFQECGPTTNRVAKEPLPRLMSDVYGEVRPELSDRNFTPVFYKKEKYNVLDSGYFLYEGLNDVNSKSVTWALFEDKKTLSKFIVASTHFWWMWESEKDNQQRLKNVDQLHEFCNAAIEKYDVPVIIGGDFNNGRNSEQGEEPYAYMKQKGFCDIRLSAEETTDEHTCHDYPVLGENDIYEKGGLPTITIDYIFTYGDYPVSAKKFDVLTSQSALDSSDHCPLIGVLENL